MKSLEGYTIEQVKEMSQEEVMVLGESVSREIQIEAVRKKIINLLDVINVENTLIEN